MKEIKNRLFSLVELALAVGILAIGATAVVTLVPTGIKQKKEAMGENYSAIFTNDAQSYFSSLAKSDFNELTQLPKFTDMFSKTDLTQNKIASAVKGNAVGNDLYETNVPGVFIISKSSGKIQDYSGEVVVWQSAPNMDKGVISKPGITPVTPPPVFNITSGTVSNTAPAVVSMKCLASEFGNGSHNYDIYFELIITEPGKAAYTIYPFGQNVAAKSSSNPWNLPNVPAGTTIVAKAIDAENPNRETDQYGRSINTTYLSTDTVHVLTLKNGDLVPTAAPFYKSQQSAGSIVKPYVSSDGNTMKLGKDQVIYLFDMNTGGSYDYQDLVVMANLAPTDTYNLNTTETGIGISPTGNDYSFELSTDTGIVFDRAKMQSNNNTSTYNSPGITFKARNLKMKTKGSDVAKLNVDGKEVNIAGKDITVSSNDNYGLSVRVWKDGNGMGNWNMQIISGKGNIINNTTPETPIYIPVPEPPKDIVTGIGVNVEISWPLSQADYSKRNKVRYYSEYYDMKNIGK